MPLISPYEPFIEEGNYNFIIRPNPTQEHRRWVEFIIQNRESLRTAECGRQIWEWGNEMAECRSNLLPPLLEQQVLIFQQIPLLEHSWNQFTLSYSNILPNFHRRLIFPTRQHLE